MQFYKLHYFLNLINVQRQCHCHQICHHYRYNQHRCQQHQQKNYHACKWKLLTFITMLITLLTVTLATHPTNLKQNLHNTDLFQNSVYPQHQTQNLENMLELANPKSVNDNLNATQDFQRILFEQLKREQELKGNSDETNLNANYDAEMASQHKMLLSRKRRYLLFPEGSSFQIVYDGIVGIVDYTNYLILGITLALAWELPEKAPSEMLEDIKTRLEDGTLLLPRNDTAKNITYVDKKKTIQKTQQRQFSKPNYINLSNQKSNYNRKPYYDSQLNNKRPMIQPFFIPPMHKNYYHQNNIESRPYTASYYYKKPGTSTKYSYYFEPRIKGSGATSYSPYHYGKEHLSDWRRKNNYYYNKNVSHKPTHPFTKWLASKSYTPPTYSATATSKYPWWNLTSRLTNSLRGGTSQKKRPVITATARQLNNINNDYKGIWQRKQEQQQNQQKRQQQMSMSGYYQSNAPTIKPSAPTQRKHRIYPVFGKRSLTDTNPDTVQQKSPAVEPIEQPHFYQQQKQQQEELHNHQNEHEQQQHQHQHHHQHQHQPRQRRRCGIDSNELSKFDRMHIRHHRRTRHTLYEKIEKYLDKRGSHGHHCVLRALCETGQKANEVEPGSFLGELMRALFTMPEPIEDDLHRLEYKETRYDAAHAYVGDCAKRYFHCKDSLWKSHFIA